MKKPESIIEQASAIAEKRWNRSSRLDSITYPSNHYIHRLHQIVIHLPETTFAISFLGSLHLASEGFNRPGLALASITLLSGLAWGMKDYLHRQQQIWDNLAP